MRLVYEYGVVDLDTILKNVGVIEMLIEDYSKVSRSVYPDVTDDNCFRLVLSVSEKSFWKGTQTCTIYKTSSEEGVKYMRENILSELKKGTEVFDIKDYINQEEKSNE